MRYVMHSNVFCNVHIGFQVKDLPVYVAAASNTSGAIPKELFEDVIEELEKQVWDLLCVFKYETMRGLFLASGLYPILCL